MSITVKAWDIVHKPIVDVWDAIVNPEKICAYFTSSVSGPIKKDETIRWDFADYGVTLLINVFEVIENEQIWFRWSASGQHAEVKIHLTLEKDGNTKIEIFESEFPLNMEGVEKVMQQTQGWTHFICSLKAWLYTGINLRKGK